MGQEFFINNQTLEDKIRQLLPSQGGAGAGFDLSASTQIIPVIDVTESAEGSNVRPDLQSALVFTGITTFQVSNTVNSIVITSTGYFRVFGVALVNTSTNCSFNLFDGTSAKNIVNYLSPASGVSMTIPYDFIIKLNAGESLRASSANTSATINGNTRQIADIDGNLTNP
jgi:hypothetical protein